MRRVWKEIPRGDKRAQWAGLYVTLNKRGTIVMSRAAHERLGGSEAFLLLYDAANNTVGLKPTARAIKNAYPGDKVWPSRRAAGKCISAACGMRPGHK